MKKYLFLEINRLTTDILTATNNQLNQLTQVGNYYIISSESGVFPELLSGYKLFDAESADAMIASINSGIYDPLSLTNHYYPPFKSKVLADGSKLYTRVHGVIKTITANNSDVISYTIPYTFCKITQIDIIENVTSQIDFEVKDPTDTAVLQQFGYGVCNGKLVYTKTSDYDSDAYSGLILNFPITNMENVDKIYGVNLYIHEVVRS